MTSAGSHWGYLWWRSIVGKKLCKLRALETNRKEDFCLFLIRSILHLMGNTFLYVQINKCTVETLEKYMKPMLRERNYIYVGYWEELLLYLYCWYFLEKENIQYYSHNLYLLLIRRQIQFYWEIDKSRLYQIHTSLTMLQRWLYNYMLMFVLALFLSLQFGSYLYLETRDRNRREFCPFLITLDLFYPLCCILFFQH